MTADIKLPTKSDAPRRLAYQVLSKAAKHGRVNDHLHRALDHSNFDAQSRKFITELVLGSTRMQGRLDHELAICYNGRYKHLEESVVSLLRLGAYQIRYMDSVPDRAAVHTTVDLARSAKLARASGLINAVLRKLTTTPTAAVEPDETATAAEFSTYFSHPEWLIKRWLSEWSPSAVIELMKWNNKRPTVWLRHKADEWSKIRLNELASEAKLELKRHPKVSNYVSPLPSSARLLESDIMDEGLFIAQDPSAGAVVSVVDPRPGETIIDLCAGPGGKTVALAEAVGPEGRIHAYEIDPDRLMMINDTLVRMGIDNVDLHPGDAMGHTLPKAHKIFIDAPCTGTGVMARRADLRWRRELKHLDELNMLQQSLLDHAASSIKGGTQIIYATCSLEPEENWGAVQAFQQRHPDLKVKPMPKSVPTDWVDDDGALATFPPIHEVDGIFAVRLGR